MGDHQSDAGLPGRRRVHPGGSVYGDRAAHETGGRAAHEAGDRAAHEAGGRPSGRLGAYGPDGPGSDGPGSEGRGPVGSRSVLDDAGLELLLAAALIRDGIDSEAEQRAVAAFRAARDAGPHRSRTRRRDDWRPRERRHPGRSLKATLSVLLASLTLGGVAVAAIGSAGSTDGADDRGRPPASTRAPGVSAGEPGDTPSGSASAHPDRPAPAQDTEAHCRAYEEVDGRGKAMDATAWKRLVEAAGGERNVTAYCAGQLARSEEKPGGTTRPDKGTDAPGSGGAGNGSGNGGTGAGNAENGSGNADTGSGTDRSGGGAADSGSSSGASSGSTGSTGSTGSSGSSGSSGGQDKPAQPNGRRP
ncbi:hypothetical protein [Streptomyces sp. NPDC000877]|uniref:hypothetical protein n=1 Tax=unclassified Streptomyces TaxID=2593676 RepID=UPI003322E5BF